MGGAGHASLREGGRWVPLGLLLTRLAAGWAACGGGSAAPGLDSPAAWGPAAVRGSAGRSGLVASGQEGQAQTLQSGGGTGTAARTTVLGDGERGVLDEGRGRNRVQPGRSQSPRHPAWEGSRAPLTAGPWPRRSAATQWPQPHHARSAPSSGTVGTRSPRASQDTQIVGVSSLSLGGSVDQRPSGGCPHRRVPTVRPTALRPDRVLVPELASQPLHLG